jgi:hypothetical protein
MMDRSSGGLTSTPPIHVLPAAARAAREKLCAMQSAGEHASVAGYALGIS